MMYCVPVVMISLLRILTKVRIWHLEDPKSSLGCKTLHFFAFLQISHMRERGQQSFYTFFSANSGREAYHHGTFPTASYRKKTRLSMVRGD